MEKVYQGVKILIMSSLSLKNARTGNLLVQMYSIL